MTSPNRIDVHQHIIPPHYSDWLRENGIRPGGIDLPDWSPAAALKFYYDIALSSTPAALPSLFEIADPAHVLYGTDFPFAPPAAVGFMASQYQRTPIEPAIRRAIDRANAEQLFPRLASPALQDQ